MTESAQSGHFERPDPTGDGKPWGSPFPPFGTTTPCPDGPHRGPQGPNEDLAQCPTCYSVSWRMRPEGEEYGGHLDDCSLPQRHEGYCVPGGDGHPAPQVVRGYWPEASR